MGRRKKGRTIDGILLLDKPAGRSSNAALQSARRLFDARKAGHTGSLDPLASGLLPVCFGAATKVSAYLLNADKCYQVRARFGEATATGDAEGAVTRRSDAPMPTTEALQAQLQRMHGVKDQIPPMYSALKHKGRRLYELAREGIEVEREPRPIRVDEFSLLAVDECEATLRVRCSKGTYVRTLVEDLAAALGHCAHVTALRRLAVGPFADQGMHTLAQLEGLAGQGREALDACLLPLDTALHSWPAVTLDPAGSFYMRNGQAVQVAGAPASGWLRVYDADKRFMAVGEVLDDGRVAPRRMLS